MTQTLTCTSCSNDIHPGEQRFPTDGGPIHGFCQTRQQARDAYRFYINHADSGTTS